MSNQTFNYRITRDGKPCMPATSYRHGLQLIGWHYSSKHHETYEYKIQGPLKYDPVPPKNVCERGYGITKPGYLFIKYLAENPCSKQCDITRHIMLGLFGELEYYGVDYYQNPNTGKWTHKRKVIYYQRYSYFFTPFYSNMTTYGRRTCGRKWVHRFKGPDGYYRYHLTALGMLAASKIWLRNTWKHPAIK